MRKSLLRHISLGGGQRVKINGPLLHQRASLYYNVPCVSLSLSLSLISILSVRLPSFVSAGISHRVYDIHVGKVENNRTIKYWEYETIESVTPLLLLSLFVSRWSCSTDRFSSIFIFFEKCWGTIYQILSREFMDNK